jgi:hypothetical protein
VNPRGRISVRGRKTAGQIEVCQLLIGGCTRRRSRVTLNGKDILEIDATVMRLFSPSFLDFHCLRYTLP